MGRASRPFPHSRPDVRPSPHPSFRIKPSYPKKTTGVNSRCSTFSRPCRSGRPAWRRCIIGSPGRGLHCSSLHCNAVQCMQCSAMRCNACNAQGPWHAASAAEPTQPVVFTSSVPPACQQATVGKGLHQGNAPIAYRWLRSSFPRSLTRVQLPIGIRASAACRVARGHEIRVMLPLVAKTRAGSSDGGRQ